MTIYVTFLLTGLLFGYFIKNEKISKIQKNLMSLSILLLLFFMGVGIGKDAELKSKIFNFGFSALTISVLSILFSVIAVYGIIKLFGKKQ